MALKKSGMTAPEVATAPVAEAPVANEAQVGAPAVDTGKASDKAERKAVAKQFRAAGKALAAEEDAAGVVKGAWRDKVQFLYPLGNPASKATGTKNKQQYETIEIVGYKFKALDAITVPVVDRTGIPKKNVMGFNSYEEVQVAAGQEFVLTIAELALMIQKVEYNGMFTGGGVSVEVGCTISRSQGTQYAPRVLLKMTETGENTTSMKESVQPVATRKQGTPADSTSIKDFEVLPEYADKFGYIYAPVVSSGRSSQEYKKREVGENAAEIAAALRAFQMKAQQ